MEILLEFGRWFESIIWPVLELFTRKGFGSFLAISILIFAVLILVIISGRYFYYNYTLGRAIRLIKSVTGEEGFSENFDRIDSEFKKFKGLRICWEEFTETLIRSEEYGLPIKNTSRPSYFFNSNEAKFDVPAAKVWPNILIGLGLVLTFAGLISALTVAVAGLEGDTTAVQKSLRELLTTTSAKFYTSLIALLSSVIMTFTFKWLESIRDKRFVELSACLEERLEYVFIEKIAEKQLEAVKEQTEVLKQFNTDLAMTLGDRIKEAMAPIVQEMSEASKNMGQGATEAIQQAAGGSLGHLSGELNKLTDVLGGMSENLWKSTEKLKVDMSEALKKMNTGMSELLDELHRSFSKKADDASSQLEESIKKLTTATEDSTAKMGQTLSGIAEQAGEAIKKAGKGVAGQFGDAGSVIDNLSESLANTEESMKKLDKSLEGVSTKLNGATKDIDETLKKLADATKKMEMATAPALGATKTIQSATSEMNAHVTKATNDIKKVLEQLETEMRNNGALWEKHAKQFDGVNEKLGEIFTNVNGQIEVSQERMQAFVTNLDSKFKDAISGLTDAIEAFAEAQETKNK